MPDVGLKRKANQDGMEKTEIWMTVILRQMLMIGPMKIKVCIYCGVLISW
jgi:hypothetical protein